MATLNRSMQYSLADATWFTLMCINNILGLVVATHAVKVVEAFSRTKTIVYPGGYWEISAFVGSTAILSAFLIHRSKLSMNKLAAGFFATVTPLLLTGLSVYRLWENLYK